MSSEVEFRELEVFVALAEELHFGRTAERLGLTHSRISQVIAKLEARLGARLFDRTSRRVQLTQKGEEFLRRVAPAYEQIQRSYIEIRESVSVVGGTLSLGIYASGGAGPHLSEMIKTFEKRHPQCAVRVIETGLAPEQFDLLRRGQLDLLVMRLPLSDPDLEIGPVLTCEERVVVVRADHTLADRSSVCVEDLAGYTTTDVAGAPRELMDAFSPPCTPSGRPIHRVYVRSIQEAGMRAATGELVHPTVASFLERYPQPGLVAVPVSDLPPATTALVWRRENGSTKVQAFVQATAEVLQPHVTQQQSGTSAS